MAVETRPKLILPGLLPPDPFLETYLVRAGGATTLELGGRQGRQEMVATAEEAGAASPAVRRPSPAAPATAIDAAPVSVARHCRYRARGLMIGLPSGSE